MKIYKDLRGWSGEIWRAPYDSAPNEGELYQYQEYLVDYFSCSREHTIRGLHYRDPAQYGLLTVVRGRIFDVMVDLETGKWNGIELEAGEQVEVPVSVAHGFCVTSVWADVIYKLSEYWQPECEFGIAWNDPGLGIPWPTERPILSERDTKWPNWSSQALVAT